MIVRNGETMFAVYLAGGFHSDWCSQVIKACRGLPFYFISPVKGWKDKDVPVNPEGDKEKEERDKKMRQSPWWHWDKLAVKVSDIVFVNCDDYVNLGGLRGIGDIFEAGMAWAQDKLVIFVNHVDQRYYRGVARNFLMFSTLEEGIECLKSGSWVLL